MDVYVLTKGEDVRGVFMTLDQAILEAQGDGVLEWKKKWKYLKDVWTSTEGGFNIFKKEIECSCQ